MIGDRLLAAHRWYFLLHGLNRGVTYYGVLRLALVSSFVGTFMPGGVDLVRIYAMTRTTADLPLALTSILVERLQSMVALVGLMLIGLAASPLELPSAITHAAWLSLLLLTAGFAAMMYSRAQRLVSSLLPGHRLAPVRAYLASIYTCLEACRDRPFLIGWSMAVAFGFQLFRVVTVLVAAWSLGLEISVLVLIALMPVVFFLSLLPISIAGGLGIRDRIRVPARTCGRERRSILRSCAAVIIRRHRDRRAGSLVLCQSRRSSSGKQEPGCGGRAVPRIWR